MRFLLALMLASSLITPAFADDTDDEDDEGRLRQQPDLHHRAAATQIAAKVLPGPPTTKPTPMRA